MTLAFWVISLIIPATPGTGAIYTIAAGLQRGRQASLVQRSGARSGSCRTCWPRS